MTPTEMMAVVDQSLATSRSRAHGGHQGGGVCPLPVGSKRADRAAQALRYRRP